MRSIKNAAENINAFSSTEIETEGSKSMMKASASRTPLLYQPFHFFVTVATHCSGESDSFAVVTTNVTSSKQQPKWQNGPRIFNNGDPTLSKMWYTG